ncbi:hypothetical protein JAAARDRAFT_167704 [Jaapia argillacea MUCL 33604]|uniref:L-2-hydroxyglutarate dehydrogenase, mitochondrial n=1 Tax=Jaapia argillacea MUCL 33604 TaxID=933084 RepID=A0A067QFM2_9AGAM|nr:hypothetical protein JAAARDRAFT_167704 [Jaapia argillacea MUCL 33604]
MQARRGLAAALNGSGRFKYKSPESVVDFLVVGGGVVGLAVAQRLSERFPNKSTFLVERHSRAGEETSSRNSEVIHAGLYYPPDSLKTRLCLRGRQMIYDRCQKYNIPHRKTGKLVVAEDHQRSYIESLHAKALKLSWPPHSPSHNPTHNVLPTELISGDKVHEMEPNLSKNIVAALWSPETGIVDSHGLMESLEKDIMESEGGALVYSTKVVRVDPFIPSSSSNLEGGNQGWVVQTVTGDPSAASEGESDVMLARTLINASGLASPLILNSLLPPESRISMFYGRGSYASYKGPGISGISHLIYPCPDTASDRKSKGNSVNFQSLGTHLTLDLQGKLRFGPDLEWIFPREGKEEDELEMDFWQGHLVPSEERLREMYEAVKSYLPGVEFDGFQPDYCGVRPKLVGPGGGFQDFVIRVDYPEDFVDGKGSKDGRRSGKGMGGQMISLLGIESPGLTSSLGIAECVVEDVLDKTSADETS